MSRFLLPSETEAMRKARARGETFREIARRYGVCYQTVVNHTVATEQTRKARNARASMVHRKVTHEAAEARANAGVRLERCWVDPEAQAERDRAYSQARSFTAAFCGDPLPGRSALDKRPKP